MPEKYNHTLKAELDGVAQVVHSLQDRLNRVIRENSRLESVHHAEEIAAIKTSCVQFDLNTDDWLGNDDPNPLP